MENKQDRDKTFLNSIKFRKEGLGNSCLVTNEQFSLNFIQYYGIFYALFNHIKMYRSISDSRAILQDIFTHPSDQFDHRDKNQEQRNLFLSV